MLQRVAANDLDGPDGSVVYTPWCDERGGMVADVTITRLAGIDLPRRDRRGLRGRATSPGCAGTRTPDEAATIRDVSGDFATIGLWGPRARDVLGAATRDPVDDAALPLRRARGRPDRSRATRCSPRGSATPGELGWELTAAADASGRACGTPSGRPAPTMASSRSDTARSTPLRMEKGYRYYGTDMTMLETPDEAGLGRFVRLGKGAFIGRDALARRARAARAWMASRPAPDERVHRRR